MNSIATITALSAFYVLFLLVFWVLNKRRPGITSYQQPGGADLATLSIAHALAIVLMLSPTWLIPSAPLSLLQLPDKLSLQQATALSVCIALIVCLPWKKWNDAHETSENYFLHPRKVIVYAAFRFSFLIAYEWFFRGLLLMGVLQVAGSLNAIVVNILLYMTAHFHKGRKEILGCIPFGLLLCLFTIWFQSIWPAVIIHVLFAVKNEWPAIFRFLSLRQEDAL